MRSFQLVVHEILDFGHLNLRKRWNRWSPIFWNHRTLGIVKSWNLGVLGIMEFWDPGFLGIVECWNSGIIEPLQI